MQLPTLAVTALLPALALSKSYNIQVGESGLSFSPSTITGAVKGDLLHFHFYPGDHSVAQSIYSKPCTPSGPNAIFSGYFNPSSGVDSQMFTVTVKDAAQPLWFYCTQGAHCSEGMSMVVNPREGQSIANYQSRSVGKASSAPSKVQGGKISKNT